MSRRFLAAIVEIDHLFGSVDTIQPQPSIPEHWVDVNEFSNKISDSAADGGGLVAFAFIA